MFGRKAQGDVKKSAAKVLDPKKENLTRQKHLRVVLDSYDTHDAKNFFDQNYSHIYFIFYEAFVTVENDLKQRANKSHREELDFVLFIFEKILTLLPELIHKRWQYHSIGRLMKKLLHSGNSIKLRREGMRLFLLWYQILMDNATEECHQTYAALVPRLGPALVSDVDIFTRTGADVECECAVACVLSVLCAVGQVSAVEVSAVLPPQSGDKQPDNLTKWLLESLLTFTVSEVKKVEWSNKEMHEFSFSFLFNKFKEHYLLHIFPEFSLHSDIYDPNLALPVTRSQDEVAGHVRSYEVSLCQEVFVKWLCIFAHAKKEDNAPSSSTPRVEKQSSTDMDIKEGANSAEGQTEGHVPGSNASTLSSASAFTEKDSTGSSVCSEEQPVSELDIVRQVLFSNKENVNIVHETFRQAFLFPFNQSGAMKKVVSVYKEWFHEDLREMRPQFLEDPAHIVEEDCLDGSPPPSSRHPIKESTEVKAGLQNVLQVFITNSANVFLLEAPENSDILEGQVDMCKRVLNIYRYMVMNHTMDQVTWEQLLLALLKIVSGVLSHSQPPKENTLGTKLAQHLFQTLIVTWIKANLNVYISAELWDHLLQVLSSLTSWVQLIREWAKTMETLTRVQARQVYGLDLNDLPLNRLSEQKKKKRLGNKPNQGLKNHQRERTFSKAWSRQEMVDSLKNQLLRTHDTNKHKSSPIIMGEEGLEGGSRRRPLSSIAGLTSPHHSNGEIPARTRSLASRQRSRSGQSSPVRSAHLVDMPSEGLVRSNSDTSLMVNLDGKGSRELLLEEESGSLNEEVLAIATSDLDLDLHERSRRDRLASQGSMYYSAPEDLEEEDDDILMQSSPPSHRSSLQQDTSLQDTSCTSAESHATSSSVATVDESFSFTKDKHLPRQKTDSINEDVFESDTLSDEDNDDNRQYNSKSGTLKSNTLSSEEFKDESDKTRPESAEIGADPVAFDVVIYDDLNTNNASVNDTEDGVTPKNPITKALLETNLDELSLSGSQSTLASLKAESLQNFQKESPNLGYQSNYKSTNSSADDLRPDGDENCNKLFELRVDEKGNVQRILVRDQLQKGGGDDTLDGGHNGEKEAFEERKASTTASLSSTDVDQSAEVASGKDAATLHSSDPHSSDCVSVVSVDSARSVPYQCMDGSTDSAGSLQFDRSSLGDTRSDTEVLLRSKYSPVSDSGSESKRSRCSESPESSDSFSHPGSSSSKVRASSEPASRVRSEPAMGTIPERRESLQSSGSHYKDSPTPDRESLHIEETDTLTTQHSSHLVSKSCWEHPTAPQEEDLHSVDMRSILAGGNLMGWTPDVSVVLWRRLIGILGDINQIQDPLVHEQVLEHLCDITETMIKIRDNIAVSLDKVSSPPPPELLPPIAIFIPWIFEAQHLSDDYKAGKLLACQLLCTCLVRRHDMEVSPDILSRFYKLLHTGLLSADQDLVSVLIRHTGPAFFSIALPGSSMLVLDFIEAANTIVTSTDLKGVPRAEAMSTLGSLLSFPNHLGVIPVLQPQCQDLQLLQCTEVKDHLISILLKSGRKEPAGLARCIAISSLGMFLYEELLHDPLHPKISETIKVLLSTLKFNNKAVAQVATDALSLLCDHVEILLQHQPDVPRKVIESICSAILYLLKQTENSNSDEDKRVLVSIMFCLLEWCLHIPIDMLLDTTAGHKSLLYKTFRVLNLAVSGTEGMLTPRNSVSMQDMLTEEDGLESVKEGLSTPSTPVQEMPVGFGPRTAKTGKDNSSAGNESLKLAARVIMSVLNKQLCHFPMGGGAARINTAIQEHHNLLEPEPDDLTAEVFNQPNLQFFVVNNKALVSFVEIPATNDFPGAGVMGGLTSGHTLMRVIIRDVCGRYSWDGMILYGPSNCRAGSYPAACVSLPTPHLLPVDLDLLAGEEDFSVTEDLSVSQRAREQEELPTYESAYYEHDNLDEMLLYIGETSPECELYHGEPLNLPFRAPEDLPDGGERRLCGRLQEEGQAERDHVGEHREDMEQVCQPMKPMECDSVGSPFHLCRLYMNQLGYLQWGNRPHFDLLRKSDKLIRELKHLDSQKCRETHKIAVIYVALGQEDKLSILSNSGGSETYENFVSGLGWEVDLEHHPGFLGGLQANKSTGLSAPYYATATKEAVFHVATRMPSDTEEDRNRKLRHLGNDEVQIVWCEHSRDYRRGVIPTEFGDVLIVIYPLQCGLYRVQINRKPEIPYFGPLFDGAIVNHTTLPGLVRATAINASHMLRTLKPYYQAFYEERARYVETVIQQHREKSTFEDFTAQVFAPVLPQGGDLIGPDLPALPSSHQSSTRSQHSSSSVSSQGDAGNHKPQAGPEQKPDKVSPQGGTSKTKDSMLSEGVSAFSRRLSFGKAKRSVSRSTRESSSTPPGSPRAVSRK